jgi:hypothetical protein
MMRFILTVLIFLTVLSGYGQKLSGQWTGGFNSNGDMFGGGNEYVLELEVKGSVITGYSYTYFIISGKRYYVICRLSGSYDKPSKSMTVREVEKVKSNTPPDFRDCLQVHYLTYLKSEGKEVLAGKWKSAKDNVPCGTGETELERKQLVRVIPQTSTPPVASKNSPPKKPTTTTTAPKTGPTRSTPPVAKTGTTPKTTTAPKTATTPKSSTTTAKPPAAAAKPNTPPVVTTTPNKTQTIDKNRPSIEKPKAPSTIAGPDISRIDKRTKQIIKTIEVDSRSFRVDLYDNGQIDGDTISLYLNGKLMVSRQRLSTEPISLNVTMTEDDNELIMYAENLGSIPPNTALMIVTVGDKRYEVNISSTEQTNGAVRFRYKSQK